MWFKVDDGLHDHGKVRKLGKDKLPAMGLWALCGSWASDNLTDGFVPSEVVRRHDVRERYAARLVQVGLWWQAERDGEAGFRFHDWHDQNPTAEKVRADRNAATERRRRWRDKNHAERHASSHGVTNGEASSTPTRPDPTPPKGGRGGGARNLRPVDNWCRECDPETRQVEITPDSLARCPRCHPLRSVTA